VVSTQSTTRYAQAIFFFFFFFGEKKRPAVHRNGPGGVIAPSWRCPNRYRELSFIKDGAGLVRILYKCTS
jgi:hypothetical protein